MLDVDRVHGRDYGKRAEHDRVSAVDLDALPGDLDARWALLQRAAPPATPRAMGSGRSPRRKRPSDTPTLAGAYTVHDTTAGHCSLGPGCRQPGNYHRTRHGATRDPKTVARG